MRMLIGYDAGEITLHAAHGDAILLLRKAVSARGRTYAGRHVDLAALHRRAAVTVGGRSLGFHILRFRVIRWPRLLRLSSFSVLVSLVNEVHVWSEFVVPIQDVQVSGVEAEAPCHVEVPWEERE